MKNGVSKDKFSINKFFRVELGIEPTAAECQFLSLGLKHATHKLNYSPIQKHYDRTLDGKPSTHYDNRLKNFALELLAVRRASADQKYFNREQAVEAVFQRVFGNNT